jgi:hypothetical protein
MKTYQIIMTKVYEVRVRANDRDHAEEIFDSMDWDELLKVHNFEIVLDDGFILEDER